jgi:2,4-dienoyl-CoA reductase-like NADH-dependent reductase (Old Yellow Enzyme family)/NADPH-dependent 2,4-dienoyl-CoA reductase/sulfur reductase-like enzyme
MTKDKKTGNTWLMNRREALKLAGFAVSGITLGLPFANNLGAQQQSTGVMDSQSKVPHFPNLFSPLKIGTFTVRNRVLSTAHFTGFGARGLPSERHKNYWGSKAWGGIGLIITEVQPVHPTAGIGPSMILCYRENVVEAFKPVVEEIHRAGARIIAQVWHPGKSTLPYSVQEVVSSSAIPSPTYGSRPRALTVAEIHNLVRSYAESAARMRKAGLDGVEIHCAHGYLPLQFMSPLQNIRTDEYGGTEENRIRFPMEIIKAVRQEIGDDFTLGIRITGDELIPGGLTLSDMKRITPKLVATGRLDYVNVSLGGGFVIAPMGTPHGAYVYLAEGIKEVIQVPVFCIGRIVDPAMAEEIVTQKRADMVGMTRANMADPELTNKAMKGRLNEIRPCIGLMTCWSRTAHPEGITCGLNPAVGHEEKFKITAAEKKKRIIVVGGGAAGMEAARVAAERRHSVTLYEKEAFLGGQLVIASKTTNRAEMKNPIAYYQVQLQKLGVMVKLGTTVTREVIERENPDEIILASGGLPKEMSIPGAEGGRVVQGRDVLMGKAETGKRAVVVAADGGMEGLSTAEFLADQGKKVEVLIPQYKAGQEVENITSLHLFYRLKQKGVVLTTRTRIESIKGRIVIASKGGNPYTIENVDTVVLSLGSSSNDMLMRSLGGLGKKVHAVGQCRQVGGLFESISDGLKIGLEI